MANLQTCPLQKTPVVEEKKAKKAKKSKKDAPSGSDASEQVRGLWPALVASVFLLFGRARALLPPRSMHTAAVRLLPS